jgi:hypothetical protein
MMGSPHYPLERTIAVFWSRVDKMGPIHPRLGTRCWLWTGAKCCGYGMAISVYHSTSKGTGIKAHRMSMTLHLGRKLKKGELVLHKCDNKPCVNPEHLYIGTDLDNARDRDTRGRANPVEGEEHYKSKLTLKTIGKAEKLRSEGWSYQRIANSLGLATMTVFYALTKKTWKHRK